MGKRLVFCFDGTWNRLSADNPTNVVILSQMVLPVAPDGTPQIVYYDEGIGTSAYFLKRLWQGALGKGMLGILREAYRFLIFNYEPGDELFIFGFSRGAFTARSFAGLIRHAGILDVASATQIDQAIAIYKHAPAGITGEESGAALRFRARFCRGVCVSDVDREFRLRAVRGFDPKTPLLTIRYVGVWDTVRALGVPDFLPFSNYWNRRYGFHDAVLTSKIKSARHAVAIDERRMTFPPTLFGRKKLDELNAKSEVDKGRAFEEWERPYQEQWFPGVHSAIGGGGELHGLSDSALHWVLSGARRAGLRLRSDNDAVAFNIRPDPFDAIFNDPPNWRTRLLGFFHRTFKSARRGPGAADEIALTTYRRVHQSPPGAEYRPRALRRAWGLLDNWAYRSPPEWKGAEVLGLVDHTLETRESLSVLAQERLGDKLRWRELFDLNRDRIDDPDFLPTDAVLRVPKPPEPPAADQIQDG